MENMHTDVRVLRVNLGLNERPLSFRKPEGDWGERY